ncbi:Aste57867_22915 [Aphanomyces stellatus]|uniref:Aste57867_22915 protein n=1 Tax=Aphanomyces stellatus TaxID=120398 RepID=A0A485LN73_9STRA|nr:hypothetical protein As57867_022844 [Aphanomyces stellatus]VFT99565.1 Aste57867_22915 [Aphanomyces stellatus]
MNAHQITTKLLSLYDTNTVNIDAIVEELYHPAAVFSDPLVEVHGRDKIAAQFRVLSSILSSSSASIIRGSVAGATILTIDSTMSCRFRPLPQYFGCSIRMFTVIELKDLKIVSHTDHWDLRSVVENVPLLSSLYPKFRFLLGSSSTQLVNAFLPRPVAALPHELLQLEESKESHN